MKRIAEGTYRQDDIKSIRLSEHLGNGQGRGDGGEGDGEGGDSGRKGSAYSSEDARTKALYHQSKQPSPMLASSVTLAATRPYPSQAASPSPSLSFSSSSPSQRLSHPLTPYSAQSQSLTQSQSQLMSQSQSQSQQHSDTNLPPSHPLPNWHRNNATCQTQPLPLSLPPYLSQSVQSIQSIESMILLDNDYERSNAARSSHSSQLRAVQGQVQGQGQGQGHGSSKGYVGQVLLLTIQ